MAHTDEYWLKRLRGRGVFVGLKGQALREYCREFPDLRMEIDDEDEPCPSSEELEALADADLPAERLLALEAHLLRCAPCLDRFRGLDAGLVEPGVLSPAASWGSSIACAVLGPPALPRERVAEMLGRLQARGFRTSTPDSVPPWVVADTSSGRLEGDEVDPGKLETFVRAVEELAGELDAGAWIDVGRGGLNRHGPFGLVFERREVAQAGVAPAEVRVSPAVARRIRQLEGLRVLEAPGEELGR